MDPITVSIIAAAGKLSETVVKDAYAGLKALIVRKFGGSGELPRALEAVEVRPDSPGRQQTLGEELAASSAAADPEVLAALARLQAALEKVAATPGGGGTVIRQQAGDHATQIGQVHGNVHFGGR